MMLGITSILSSWGAGTIGQSDWVGLQTTYVYLWPDDTVGPILREAVLSHVVSTGRCTRHDHQLCSYRCCRHISFIPNPRSWASRTHLEPNLLTG
jgi:hypothetical protein